jgi:hypothetical protein
MILMLKEPGKTYYIISTDSTMMVLLLLLIVLELGRVSSTWYY